MSYYQFADEEGKNPHGSCEVFYSPDGANGPGWYWHACFPGCMPDGEASGPFDSEDAAKEDAGVYEDEPGVPPAEEQKTAIEVLADAVRSGYEQAGVGTVLVPEQCMEFYIGDKQYHVTIEEVKDEDGPIEDDTLRSPQPVEAPHADMARELDAVVNKYDLSALRDAVAKLEQRYRDEIASYHDDHAYETFDALSNDFSDRTVSLLHAEGLEDLFDMIEPWLMGGSLTLEQKVKVVRALKDAKPVSEGMDNAAITDIIDLGDNAPTFYIQLC